MVFGHLSSLRMLCVGKVAVKKEDLQKYHGKDTWFQLQPVSADSEVQVGTERKLTHITQFHNKALSFHLVYLFRFFVSHLLHSTLIACIRNRTLFLIPLLPQVSHMK